MKRTCLGRIIGITAAIVTAGISGYVLAVRPWHLRWGATAAEVDRPLPGDELVPRPRIKATHAITIGASTSDVWPWLAQIGVGRGGFYSYDWIENLMGLGVHSADRIIPELQNPQVGEDIPLAPGGFGVPVAAVEPGRLLLLHGDTRSGTSSMPGLKPGDFFNTSWTFFLQERGDGTTRLIERFQTDYRPSFPSTLFCRVILEPGSFLMERKMLLGLKKRAERGTGRRATIS